MEHPSLTMIVLVGAVAGWGAGMVLKGQSLGLIGNILAGVAGAFVGSRLAYAAGISVSGLFGMLVVQFIGAVIVLVVLGAARKAMGGGKDG